jgi:hypothetical protein
MERFINIFIIVYFLASTFFMGFALSYKIPCAADLHYGPGLDSASNRNEYHESSWE